DPGQSATTWGTATTPQTAAARGGAPGSGRRWRLPVAGAVAVASAVSAAAVLLLVSQNVLGGQKAPEGPVATRDHQFGGTSFNVTIDAVRRRGTSVGVQWTVKSTGGGDWWPP